MKATKWSNKYLYYLYSALTVSTIFLIIAAFAAEKALAITVKTSIGEFYSLFDNKSFNNRSKEFIIVFSNLDAYKEFLNETARNYGIQILDYNQGKVSRHKLHNIYLALVKLTPQQYDKLLELKREGKIIKIFPNRRVRVLLQDTTRLLNATDTWEKLNITGKGSLVCVLDTGVDYTHPDLNGSVELNLSWDYVNWDPDPMDDNGHGTHVAGIIAANGTLKGIAPGAKIIAMKVLDKDGYGWEWDIIWALLDCALYKEEGYNISAASMSLGTWSIWSYYCDEEDALAWFVTYVREEYGLPVIVAAGNSYAIDGISSPACARGAISVGAIDKENKMASFSNRGSILDVVSYGVNINSTVPSGDCELCSPTGYMELSGTSMATPHISGIAALLSEVNRSLSPSVIEGILKFTAPTEVYDEYSNRYYPIPNAYYAVRALMNNNLVNITDENGKIICESQNLTVRLIVTDYWINEIQSEVQGNGTAYINVSEIRKFPANVFCIAYNDTEPVAANWIEKYIPPLKIKEVWILEKDKEDVNDSKIFVDVAAITSVPEKINVEINVPKNIEAEVSKGWWITDEEIIPYPGSWWGNTIAVNIPVWHVWIDLKRPENVTNISVIFSINDTNISKEVVISLPVVLKVRSTDQMRNITYIINPAYHISLYGVKVNLEFEDRSYTNYYLPSEYDLSIPSAGGGLMDCTLAENNSIMCTSDLPINYRSTRIRIEQYSETDNYLTQANVYVKIPDAPDYAYYLTEDWENIGIQCIIDTNYKYMNLTGVTLITYSNGSWSIVNITDNPDVMLVGLYASVQSGSRVLLIKCKDVKFKELTLRPGWNLVSGYSMNPDILIAAWLSGHTKQPVMNYIGVSKVHFYWGGYSYMSYDTISPILDVEDLETFFDTSLWSQYRYPYETLSYWVYIPVDVKEWRYIYPALPRIS